MDPVQTCLSHLVPRWVEWWIFQKLRRCVGSRRLSDKGGHNNISRTKRKMSLEFKSSVKSQRALKLISGIWISIWPKKYVIFISFTSFPPPGRAGRPGQSVASHFKLFSSENPPGDRYNCRRNQGPTLCDALMYFYVWYKTARAHEARGNIVKLQKWTKP